MIKAILFDLDGVLVEARELHYQALNRALERFGYRIERDEHLSTFDGLPTKKKLELLTERKGLPPELYEDIWTEKQLQTRAIISTEFTPDRRMRSILQRLRSEGYKLAVCSNSIRETCQLILEKKGLLEFFDAVLSNQDVAFSKPHPEMFLRAMVTLGVGPRECLVVEDSHRGREATEAAGAYLCGVAGTSEVTFERVAEAIREANAKEGIHTRKPKWQGRDLRIVIPMAGEGKSFERAGYTFPKPLIDIRGKPMVQWVVENMNTEGRFIFIVRREHLERYSLSHLLNLIAPGCEVVALDEKTEGAAATVLMAAHLFDDDKPLAIVNSDQILEWDSNEFFYAMAADECDGGIVTFQSTHPKWSFVKLEENGFVFEVAEKVPISDQATAGVYYYRRGADFVRAANRMIAQNIRTRGEFYVCPAYNELLREGGKIRAFPVRKVWSLGTPEDVERFHKEYPFYA